MTSLPMEREEPSVAKPCGRCGLTGVPMVDWCAYARHLEGLLLEIGATVKLPPHLAAVVSQLGRRAA